MKTLIVILAAVSLMTVAAPASAHLYGRPHGHSLKITLAYQEHQYAHALYVCRRGSGEPKRWHCPWVPILRHEIAKTRARLAPARPAVDGCLSALIQRESGWNVHATNSDTGAYGLPQALPGSKMASAGPNWRHDPATQIRWMVGYVNGRYGGSCAALSHQIAYGWY